jgi:FecR protein
MKINRTLLNGLISCGIAVAMVSSLTAQTAIQSAAKVLRIRGSARYKTATSGWQPLHVGDLIKPGTVVQTSKEADGQGYVDVSLSGETVALVNGPNMADLAPAAYNVAYPPSLLGYRPSAGQDVIRIKDNSALSFDALSSTETGAGVVTDTELDLKTGRIFVSVKKMTAGSKYIVKMPQGVAGIRGTTAEFFAEGVIKLNSGALTAAYMDNNNQATTTDMTSGQGLDMRTGSVTPLTPGESQEIDATTRDMAFVYHTGFVTGVISPDFTCNHMNSANNTGP